jgi:hypothetical protein
MATPIRFKKILGIDNTSDLASDRIKGQGIYLYECDNVDIDDENKPHRREGDEEKVIDSTTVHSIWSDGETFLYADGTVFKKLNKDDSATILINGIDPNDRMAYVKDNNQIFFGNGSIVGYIIDGLPYPFLDPNQIFKMRMVGGQLLEIYNNRLYAANGPNLFFSDATVKTRMDKRKNAIAFHNRITMNKAVLDGIYIGIDNAVIFLKGSDPGDFVQITIPGIGVIEGTAIVVEDDDIGRGATGKTVYWTSKTGAVYKGYPGGIVVQCQGGLFSMADLDTGTSILKDDHGYQQYLAVCPLVPGKGGASGEARITRPSITGTD